MTHQTDIIMYRFLYINYTSGKMSKKKKNEECRNELEAFTFKIKRNLG